jgi:hypothetical protein
MTAAGALLACTALSATVQLRAEADIVLAVAYDRAAAVPARLVEALTVVVDGTPAEEILVFPESGRSTYDAVVGPLPAGAHTIAVRGSELWPSAVAHARDLTARVVAPGDEDFEIVRHAPAIWARADTIGAATDMPLVLYVESDAGRSDGSRQLTYSLIFSNEDGGTPTRALLARWGRTSDIEWAYAVRLSGGRAVDETFQAANHGTQPFRGEHIGAHPVLLVATLNNVFADRGRGPALVRPVPRAVDLRHATRESVMDREPWTYRVMARELEAEHKIDAGPDSMDPNLAGDPRSYVYVEGQLALDRAAVAAMVEDDRGVWHSSHLGVIDYAVARDGWVRVAVRSPGARLVGWQCLPLGGALPRDPRAPSCRIEGTRAFRLGDDYRPGPTLVEPKSLTLAAGETMSLPAAAASRER